MPAKFPVRRSATHVGGAAAGPDENGQGDRAGHATAIAEQSDAAAVALAPPGPARGDAGTMSSRNPADEDGVDAIVMRPLAFRSPGQPDPTPSAEPPEIVPLDGPAVAALTALARNPLLGAAAPLLALATRVNDATAQRDVDGLRKRLITAIHRFESAGAQTGLTADQIRVGRYALCATVDDVVLATAWGRQNGWAARSLVATVVKEAADGARFFELLDQMREDPHRFIAELELFHVCLSLGFQGRCSEKPRGQDDLDHLRETLHRTIRRTRGDAECDLSPSWRGIAGRDRPPGITVPRWVAGAILAALLMLLYMGFAAALGERVDAVNDRIATLLPTRPVEIARLGAADAPAPLAAATGALQRVAARLAAEVADGQVEVLAGERGGTVVRIRAPLFPSGGDTIDARWRPLIDSVARAVAAERGPVQVVGHTDAVPIRSIRFPSNRRLSLARAEMVAGLMAPAFGGPERLTAEGRGDAQPVADNATPQGRQHNRRIEILLDAR